MWQKFSPAPQLSLLLWATLGCIGAAAALSGDAAASAACPEPGRPGILNSDQPRQPYVGDRLILRCCLQRPAANAEDSSIGGVVWFTPTGVRVGYLGVNSPQQGAFILSESAGSLHSAVLVLTSVERQQHNGDFVCRDADSLSSSGGGASATVRVIVRDRLQLAAPSVQWLRAGSPGQLLCRASPATASVAWYRGRERLPADGESSSPLLSRVRLADAGAYACKGELSTSTIDGVDVGESSIDVAVVEVRVYQTPSVTLGPTTVGGVKALQGRVGEFECVAESWPAPRIDWLIDNRSIDASDPATVARFAYASRPVNYSGGNVGGIGSVANQPVRMRSLLKAFNFLGDNPEADDRSAGQLPSWQRRVPDFTCQAVLSVPDVVIETARQSFVPQVVYKPQISPTWQQDLFATGTVGGSASLVCQADGPDPAEIQLRFMRGNLAVGNNGLSGRVTLTEERGPNFARLKMQLVDLRRTDAGEFVCVAATAAGSVTRVGRLDVQYAPRILEPRAPVRVYTWHQHPTEITCTASGRPSPEFTWELNGLPLSMSAQPTYRATSRRLASNGDENGEEVFIAELSFSPTVSSGYGSYACRVANNVGWVRSPPIDVFEARRPGTPDIVIDTGRSSPTSLVFSLIPPADTGGAPLSGYEIAYRVNDGPEIGPAAFSLDREIRLKYLQPRTNYKVFIVARNLVGSGGRAEINYTTGDLAPPGDLKLDAKFLSDDPDGLLMRLSVLNDGGLPVDRYRVRLRRVRGDIDPDGRPRVVAALTGWTPLNPSAAAAAVSTGRLRLDKLQPGTFYEVEIHVGNPLGMADRPKVHVFRTAGEPHQVNVLGVRNAACCGSSFYWPVATALLSALLTHFTLI